MGGDLLWGDQVEISVTGPAALMQGHGFLRIFRSVYYGGQDADGGGLFMEDELEGYGPGSRSC